ncbi:unnamed protein product [Owenia fusiformis]|uniref:Uncharacterized protein n=1 Tax=Owenia fusiformis TaxID=6347 RepID=A0A8S4NWW4_OWEFU|nr:unnamed protein product [Owenia fusiformis]
MKFSENLTQFTYNQLRVPFSSIVEVLSPDQIAKVAEMATTMMADFKPDLNACLPPASQCGQMNSSQGTMSMSPISPASTLSPNPDAEKCYLNLDKWQTDSQNGYNDISLYDDHSNTSGYQTVPQNRPYVPQPRSCTPQTLCPPTLCQKSINGALNGNMDMSGFKATANQATFGIKQEADTYDCPVEDIVMDQVRRDMQLACTRLDIPADPYQWSPSQTKAWLAWNIDQFRLHAVNLAYFDMNGTTLCMLSEDDFKARAPLGGEMLYAQLEIWRNGFKLFEITPPTSPSSPPSTFCQQYGEVRNPQKGGVPSPCPSTESSDSAYSAASATSPRNGYMEAQTSFNNNMFQYEQQQQCSPEPVQHGRQNIHLWQFLKELLLQPQHYGNAIRWVDRSKGIFKIEDSARVARLWGKRKNRPAMNYDKLSRSIRQYYRKGIIKKTEQSKRLVYQFCHPYLL